MAGSDLSGILEQCYGLNAILHMLSGLAVPRAQLGHFLVDGDLGNGHHTSQTFNVRRL